MSRLHQTCQFIGRNQSHIGGVSATYDHDITVCRDLVEN